MSVKLVYVCICDEDEGEDDDGGSATVGSANRQDLTGNSAIQNATTFQNESHKHTPKDSRTDWTQQLLVINIYPFA